MKLYTCGSGRVLNKDGYNFGAWTKNEMSKFKELVTEIFSFEIDENVLLAGANEYPYYVKSDKKLKFLQVYDFYDNDTEDNSEEKSWHKGYKEVKNVIHNDIGVTKEEIIEVFRQVAKDEIQKHVFDKKEFIYECIRDVIRQEMVKAVEDHRYPRVRGNIISYGMYGGETAFKDYVSGVMKEEIVKELREQFDVSLGISKKD